jgi:hypothetical protein
MKILLTLAAFLFAGSMQAQVNTYPYLQSFETPFEDGKNIYFIPNWWGNYVALDTMGQYDAFAHSGSHSLYMLPEGEEFKTMAQVKLDLTHATNSYAEFWVASRRNGSPEDQKRVKLNVAISIDGGVTFPYVLGFGPHEGFQNADTEFEKFTFVFPPSTNNQPNVVLRFIGKSGGGPHLPGMLLIDDVAIAQAATDTFPPYIMGAELSISVVNSLKIPFSEPLLQESASMPEHYKFTWPVEEDGTPIIGDGPLPMVSNIALSSNGYEVTLTLDPPLSVGETYALEMYDLADLNGNVAELLLVDGIVYNVPPPGSLVFSEVLFADPSGTYPKGKLQYVELYNPTTDIVPLGGLRIKGSIAAHDLPNIKLNPGEYWVATRNAESYYATFGKAAWEWKGSWIEYEAEEGESLEPQTLYIQTTNRHSGVLVDSIGFDFSDPTWSALNKPGYSIEVCNNLSDNLDPANWSLANDNRDPYLYLAEGQQYNIFATPGTGCLLAEQAEYYCTYGQGFYGNVGGSICSIDGSGSTPLQTMQSVLPVGQQKIFGLVATNRYFILKGTDIANGYIFNMLPAGKAPAPLKSVGASTYSSLSSWGAVPLSKNKSTYGKIENNLLGQAITLYFNLMLNESSSRNFSLATFELEPVIVTAKSSDCGSSAIEPLQNQYVTIPQKLIDYLNNNYASGATVGNLFELANRLLGGDPVLVQFNQYGKPSYLGITASEVSDAVEAINTIFNECRVFVPGKNMLGTAALRTSSINAEEESEEYFFDEAVHIYPNPFADQTTIEFTVPVDTYVVLQVYTLTGTKVETLFEGEVKANEVQRVNFAPPGNPSGFYLYRLSTGRVVKVGKILSVKR